MASESEGPGLSKEKILSAFARLNDHLADNQIIGELCLFGGTAMLPGFNARPSTRDVDAIFQPAAMIREFAKRVAEEQELPLHWLNDVVKGFQSEHPEITSESLPQYSHLRIYRPTAEYLLAMKCLAARATGPETLGDKADILTLIRRLKFQTVEEVTANLIRFFPPNRIPAKAQFMIHEASFEIKDPAASGGEFTRRD